MAQINRAQFRTVHTIPAAVVDLVLIALPEFERKSIELIGFDLAVDEDEKFYYITNFDPAWDGRGSPPGRPLLTVEISKPDRKAVRSYYNK